VIGGVEQRSVGPTQYALSIARQVKIPVDPARDHIFGENGATFKQREGPGSRGAQRILKYMEQFVDGDTAEVVDVELASYGEKPWRGCTRLRTCETRVDRPLWRRVGQVKLLAKDLPGGFQPETEAFDIARSAARLDPTERRTRQARREYRFPLIRSGHCTPSDSLVVDPKMVGRELER